MIRTAAAREAGGPRAGGSRSVPARGTTKLPRRYHARMDSLRDVIAGRSTDFAVFWHRAGNSTRGLDAALAANRDGPRAIAGRRVRHGVECDLKWAWEAGEPLLYLHHGLTGLERLQASDVRAGAARGEILLLEALLARPGAERLDYMIELKGGPGAPAGPLRRLADLVRARALAERVSIVASSLALLEDARGAFPEAPRGLFVWCVTPGGRILHVPKLAIRRSLGRGFVLAPGGTKAAEAAVSFAVATHFFGTSAEAHLARERRARAGGTAWIPGTVRDRAALEGLARGGARGAFAYMEPVTLGT